MAPSRIVADDVDEIDKLVSVADDARLLGEFAGRRRLAVSPGSTAPPGRLHTPTSGGLPRWTMSTRSSRHTQALAPSRRKARGELLMPIIHSTFCARAKARSICSTASLRSRSLGAARNMDLRMSE